MLKKTVLLPAIAFVLGALLASILAIQKSDQPRVADTKQPLYWVAPMDANYRKDAPGKSPMGMDLVPVYQETNKPAAVGTVTISPHVENQLGVKTAPVKSAPLPHILDVAGFLQYDESSVQHYHSRTNGWVEKLYVYSVGDQIKRGQKLYDVYSPDLVYGQEEFISALNTGNKNLLQSSRLKLNALGLNSKQISWLEKHKRVKQNVTFFAQRSGYISHLNIREGMYIQPNIELLATADLSSIWVVAEVFESQLAWLEVGLPVTMTVNAFSNKSWQGKIDYIFPDINAQNRTQQVRVVFNNPDLVLKPAMFAQLNIHTKPLPSGLLVPSNAIIMTGSNQRVVLALGDGQYRSVVVTTGRQSNNLTQILSGVTHGQVVVTSAQFLIDSESTISAELSRIDAPANTHDEHHQHMHHSDHSTGGRHD